ncbi:MAG: T9SS type A sorting domain-containing protein, partial [Bacteroidia bacterium]|nr:T9SS type A sorting domain-containing protein [Bacteroidia bacterium]
GVESVASNSVIPTGTTGLDNVTNTLSIYKNANNQLVVTNASLKTGTISIYNAVGQRVCNTVINGISTTIHKTFNAGVYLILVKSDGKTNSTKVIF